MSADGQRTKRYRNISISIAWVGRTNVTDRQTTDGRPMTYSLKMRKKSMSKMLAYRMAYTMNMAVHAVIVKGNRAIGVLVSSKSHVCHSSYISQFIYGSCKFRTISSNSKSAEKVVRNSFSVWTSFSGSWGNIRVCQWTHNRDVPDERLATLPRNKIVQGVVTNRSARCFLADKSLAAVRIHLSSAVTLVGGRKSPDQAAAQLQPSRLRHLAACHMTL